MTEYSMPFQPGNYDEVTTRRIFKDIIPTSGYIDGKLNELVVSAPTADPFMSVNVATGGAFVDGGDYLNDAIKSLAVAAADSTYTRIDRVVVRLTVNAPTSKIELAVKTGTPASSPVEPSLTNNATTVEIALAKLTIPATTTAITAGMITDERTNAAPLPHTHAESEITGLATDLAAKAPVASPDFSGTPQTVTPTVGDNSRKVASTAFVKTALDNLSVVRRPTTNSTDGTTVCAAYPISILSTTIYTPLFAIRRPGVYRVYMKSYYGGSITVDVIKYDGVSTSFSTVSGLETIASENTEVNATITVPAGGSELFIKANATNVKLRVLIKNSDGWIY